MNSCTHACKQAFRQQAGRQATHMPNPRLPFPTPPATRCGRGCACPARPPPRRRSPGGQTLRARSADDRRGQRLRSAQAWQSSTPPFTLLLCILQWIPRSPTRVRSVAAATDTAPRNPRARRNRPPMLVRTHLHARARERVRVRARGRAARTCVATAAVLRQAVRPDEARNRSLRSERRGVQRLPAAVGDVFFDRRRHHGGSNSDAARRRVEATARAWCASATAGRGIPADVRG
eukprot:363142-Chlamydomonas_euryale.AAC.9